MKTRREFISQAATGSCMLLAGSSVLFLSSCTASKATTATASNEISVPLSSFDQSQNVIVKHKEQGHILVRKKEDGTYEALSLACTHKGAVLVENDGELKCPMHGSTFSMDGKVTGGPAKIDLPKFATSVVSDNVVVKIG